MFETIVVGAGPAGLTLASYSKGPVCLLEATHGIGGCHRVDRRDVKSPGLFAEHAPRMYHGSYVNVRDVLRDVVGLEWDDVFEPIEYSPERIDGKRWYGQLSLRESALVSLEYLRMVTRGPRLPDQTNSSMRTWCERRGFSEPSKAYIDAVCRFSDGAGADRYSLFEFLRAFDHHALLPFYQPRKANDRNLFEKWQDALERKGVTIVRDARVARLLDGVGVELNDGKVVRGKRVVFAIPPVKLAAILNESKLREPGFEAFAKATNYETYYGMTFHFPKGTDLALPEGLRSTPWKVGYVHMKALSSTEPYEVLSVAITDVNARSPATNKTAARTKSRDSLVRETWRQLREAVPSLPKTYVAVSMPTVYDTAFVAAAGKGYVPPPLRCCRPGFAYSVGTHNGNSSYDMTSMESAVQNALAFLGKPRGDCVTMGDLIVFAAYACVVLVAFRMLRRG